jgi:polyisoprenoid-binding protein YceI
MNWSTILALCLLILESSAGAHAQPREIDVSRSTMTVRVFKAGVFSAFGHDHEIAAMMTHGSVDTGARQVELQVKASALEVRDAKASDKDRVETRHTMLGPEVLDAQQYPEIQFRSASAEQSGAGAWNVHGDLILHGQTHPVAMEVRESGGHYTGSCSFRLTDFGIKPVKIAGGTVKVKDEIRVDFDIQLAR